MDFCEVDEVVLVCVRVGRVGVGGEGVVFRGVVVVGVVVVFHVGMMTLAGVGGKKSDKCACVWQARMSADVGKMELFSSIFAFF